MTLFKRILVNIIVLLFSVNFFFSEKWVGQAATYQKIQGSKTASGETFDKDGLFAACNGFKIGSEIQVINTKTGKTINVIVNDRITQGAKYFILLTPKAAREIGFEWDTGLVVVNADFSDVNSTERIAINGLVREGEIDFETIKLFPDIKWPEDKDTVENQIIDNNKKEFPDIKDEITPDKKEKIAMFDSDEANDFYKPKDELIEKVMPTPKEESYLTPESKMREYMMNEDIDDKMIPRNDDRFAFIPDLKKDNSQMDKDVEIEDKKTETQITKDEYIPDVDNKFAYVPEKKEDSILMDKDIDLEEEKDIDTEKIITVIPEDDNKEKEDDIIWISSLQKGKTYIRFYTTFDKTLADEKLLAYRKVFPNVIGIKPNGKYILYVGPINKNDVDIILKNIRSYGFRDAFVIDY